MIAENNLINSLKYKVVIHGTGIEYNMYYSRIAFFEAQGNCEVIGISSEDKYFSTLDGYKFIPEEKLSDVEFDYIFVTNKQKFIRNVGSKFEEKAIPIEVLDIPNFNFNRWLKIRNSKLTIVSNTCWGGLTYHFMHLPFNSPFINMHFDFENYLLLLSNFRECIKGKLEQVDTQYDYNLNREYPVMLLNNEVTLHFNHYTSEAEAIEAWARRVKRVNTENILFQLSTVSPEDAKRFLDVCPEDKIVFVPYETNEKGLLTVLPYLTRNDEHAEFWRFVTLSGKGRFSLYDVWELLENKRIKLRIK